MVLAVTHFGVRIPRWLAAIVVCVTGLMVGITLLPPEAFGSPPGVLMQEDPEDELDPRLSGDSDGDGVLDKPDVTSAAATARLVDEPVEVMGLRTESAQTFVNPDGTLTTEDFGEPVRIERDGEWVDVSYDLVANEDGSFSPAASAVDVVVAGEDREAVRVAFDDGETLAVTWPEDLPEPTVEGGVATYELSAVMDLLVVMTGSGAAVRLRLNEAPELVEADPVEADEPEVEDPEELLAGEPEATQVDDQAFTFGLEADGLEVEQGSDGQLRLLDGSELLGQSAAFVAWDARIDEAGDPLEVIEVEAEVDQVGGSGEVSEHELTVTAPAEFLHDSATQYPVVIDPDIASLGRVRDTWVRSGTTAPKDLEHRLLVGSLGESANKNQILSYLKFDAPNNIDVAKAELGLWQYHSAVCANRTMMVTPARDAWASNIVWTTRPGYRSGTGHDTTITQNKGRPGCANGADGWVKADVTDMVNAWATGIYPDHGFRLAVPTASATDASFERRFCSFEPDTSYPECDSAQQRPYLSVTYWTTPDKASAPITSGRTWDDTFYIPTTTPEWTTSATSGDGMTLGYRVSVHTSTSGTLGSRVAWCNTPGVPAGSTSSCTPSNGTLVDGQTYYVRASAHNDMDAHGAWSEWTEFTVDVSMPTTPSIACTGLTHDDWFDTRAAAISECTFTSAGSAVDVEWTINDEAQTPLAPGTPVSLDVPESGFVKIEARARNAGGAVSDTATFSFGVGEAALVSPVIDDRTSGVLSVLANAPAAATSVKVQWRHAPIAEDDETTGWADVSDVKVAETQAAWDGSVSGSSISTTPALHWRPTDEEGVTAPSVVQVRAVFSYPGDVTRISAIHRVSVVPHAFGGSFPVQDVGPVQVGLYSGEMQFTMDDVSVPGYAEELTFNRSHLSLAGDATGSAGLFGPGWIADFSGSEGVGTAGFTVVDNTEVDGSITLQDPEGETYVYAHSSGRRGERRTGRYLGVAETALEEDDLRLAAVGGSSPFTHRLTLTEWDDSRTIWGYLPGKGWIVEQVIGPEANSTTTYGYDPDGDVMNIFAPTPDGMLCNTSTQHRGCRFLRFVYEGTGDEKRLVEIRARAFDPQPGADGSPSGSGAMTTRVVARYEYDAFGRLAASWDPRLGDGANALKTIYAYNPPIFGGDRTVLTQVTEPGLTPWEFYYGGDGRLATIKRAQDSAVGSGKATWTVGYDRQLDAAGDGLPNLGGTATATWGQGEAHAPVGGTAVWEPDRVPAASPSAADYEYASLSYYTAEGRTTNTASFGAGAWQIDSTRYDSHGNTVWELSAEGRRLALEEAGGNAALSAGLAEKYATLNVYNDTGTRIEETWEPTRLAASTSATSMYPMLTARQLTEFVYDDEATSAQMPGRPTVDVPEEGFGLVIREIVSTTTSAYPGAPGSKTNSRETRYRYDPFTTGDGDGWELKTPTRTLATNGSGGWHTTISRFDTEGLAIQSRTPEGVATGQQARWTNTVYYTRDASASRAECRNKPEWVGQVCWTGPAAAVPSGHAVPATRTAGYSQFMTPTRVEEVSGSVTRANVTILDVAEREVTSKVSVSGLSSSQSVSDVSTTYSSTTGAVTSVSNGTFTQVTGYDTWGRAVSQTDGAGNTATTAYDAAGRVATANDGKGTYTYTYDGEDSKGRKERRGLITGLDVGLATGTEGGFTGAYDAAGNLIEQNYPGDVKAVSTYDLHGDQRSVSYSLDGTALFGMSQIFDHDSKVRVDQSPQSSRYYSYDSRDRLIEAKNYIGHECIGRTYVFSADSNRTSLTERDCDSSDPGITTTYTHDQANRITSSGYTYDQLGRTLTVPAGHTDAVAGSGNLLVGYHDTDMVASLTQTVGSGSSAVVHAQQFGLDASGRISTIDTSQAGTEIRQVVNHYDADDDAPAWSQTKVRESASDPWETTWTRQVTGLGGDMAIIQDSDGLVRLQLVNLHDDIAAVLTLGGVGVDSFTEYDEYGTPRADTANAPERYGWLGAKQRDANTVGGLTLMGVRLYNPITGRFLSRDPVDGGNDNTYTYPPDPINKHDAEGDFWKKLKKKARSVGKSVWKNRGRIAVGAAFVGASIACGASIVCGMSVGAAAGFTRYTMKNRGGKWSWRGAAKATAVGAGLGSLSKIRNVARGRISARHVGSIWKKPRFTTASKRHRASRSWKPWRWK